MPHVISGMCPCNACEMLKAQLRLPVSGQAIRTTPDCGKPSVTSASCKLSWKPSGGCSLATASLHTWHRPLSTHKSAQPRTSYHLGIHSIEVDCGCGLQKYQYSVALSASTTGTQPVSWSQVLSALERQRMGPNRSRQADHTWHRGAAVCWAGRCGRAGGPVPPPG